MHTKNTNSLNIRNLFIISIGTMLLVLGVAFNFEKVSGPQKYKREKLLYKHYR